GCIAVVWPLAMHPTNKNEVLVWDCAHDPAELFTLDVDAIRLRMFTRGDALPEGVTRLPVKGIHINKSPMLVSNLKTLSESQAQRWGIDVAACVAHAAAIAAGPDMTAVWERVYQRGEAGEALDVDEDLYGGF